MKHGLIFFFLSVLLLAACNSEYTPKKKGYFRISFPEKKYQLFDKEDYPYSFEYPVYATIIKDSTFFEEKAENPWWINIDIPQFSGRIYISYKEVAKSNFDSLVNDSYEMAYKQHTEMATKINDSMLRTPTGTAEGVYFSLGGNTATANQFFLTDSITHFLRGALYFDAAPNSDSLSIVNSFLKTDLQHLINTLKWKNPGSASATPARAQDIIQPAARKPENEKAEHK